MDNITKLEMRTTELASAHLACLDDIEAALERGDATANNIAELEKKAAKASAELNRANAELMAARVAAHSDTDGVTAASGDTFSSLVKRCEVRNYLAAAASENNLSGAEKELNEQLHGHSERGALGGVRIPWRLLAPEERADVPSNLPAGAGPRSERDFIGRVFRDSVSNYLGVKTEQVPSGESSYTVLTAGAEADMLAKAALKESTAATITKVDMNPTRLAARYTIAVEDLARSNLYEAGLREDLRNVLTQKIDDQVVNGNGQSPEVNGLLNDLPAATGAVTASAAYGDYVLRIAGAIDGLYASALPQLRMLVNPDVYAAAVNSYRSDETDLTVLGWAQMFTGGIRASAHMPVASNSNVGRILIHKTGGDMSPNACAAFWNSPELIRDHYTDAGKGQVHLTLMQLWDFAILREAAWSQKRVKIA